MLAQDCQTSCAYGVQDEVLMNGAIVLPHKEIKESVLDPGTIIM